MFQDYYDIGKDLYTLLKKPEAFRLFVLCMRNPEKDLIKYFDGALSSDGLLLTASNPRKFMSTYLIEEIIISRKQYYHYPISFWKRLIIDIKNWITRSAFDRKILKVINQYDSSFIKDLENEKIGDYKRIHKSALKSAGYLVEDDDKW